MKFDFIVDAFKIISVKKRQRIEVAKWNDISMNALINIKNVQKI